jgi:rubrerythrin
MREMGRCEDTDYGCQVCGSEADLILEGFDSVGDVMKVGTLACRHCASKEDIVLSSEGDEIAKAVTLAVERERESYLFYRAAAENTSSDRGRDMFNQLADFELNHYKEMIHLSHSLQKRNRWISYPGHKEVKPSRRFEPLDGENKTKQDDIGALTMAIRKENEAQAFYEEMAVRTEDPAGKQMFNRLAGEEEVHRRILNDQLYSLSNKGLWVWGE